MTFKNKQSLIDFIKHQCGVEMINEPNSLNTKRKILYTELDKLARQKVLPLLNKRGIRYESHTNNGIWIFLS